MKLKTACGIIWDVKLRELRIMEMNSVFLSPMRQLVFPRNRAADLLKGFAVVMMIQVHLMELFARQEIFDSEIGRISLFMGGIPAAPVFMAVMGYYMARSARSFSGLLLRGFKLILMGFLLNIGLNAHLMIKIANGTFDLDPYPYIFGVDIFFLAGIVIILLALIRQTKHQLLISVAVLVLIFLVQEITGRLTDFTSGNYLTAFFYGEGIWWSYFPVIPWMAYPLTGFVFQRIESAIIWNNRTTRIAMLVIIVAMAMVTFKFVFQKSVDLQEYYHHNYLFYASALFYLALLVLLANYTAKKLSNMVIDYLAWLGKNVTAVYVVQWLIIGNVATAIYKTRTFGELLIWFIGLLIATSAIVWAREKLLLTYFSKPT